MRTELPRLDIDPALGALAASTPEDLATARLYRRAWRAGCLDVRASLTPDGWHSWRAAGAMVATLRRTRDAIGARLPYAARLARAARSLAQWGPESSTPETARRLADAWRRVEIYSGPLTSWGRR